MDPSNESRWMRGIAVLSLLGFLWLFVLLAQNGQPSRKEAFFRLEAFPLDLNERARLEAGRSSIPLLPSEAGVKHSILLSTARGGELAKAGRVGLEIEAGQPAVVAEARLILEGRRSQGEPVIYVSRPNRKINGTRSLALSRLGDAPRDVGSSARLEIRTTEPVPLALRAQKTADAPVSPFLWTELQSEDGTAEFASVQGWYRHNGGDTVYSRAELLAYTWGWGTAGAWRVYTIWSMATLLWCGGLLLLLKNESPQWAGWGLLGFATAMLYAVFTPPFQTPDEPDHLLTFAAIVEDAGLPADSLALANKGHFERIKFRSEESFASEDVGRPLDGGWASHVYATELDRSPFARAIWSFIGQAAPEGNTSAAMFTLRITNGLFLVLCLSTALAAGARVLSDAQTFWWLSAPVLLLPALAFLGTAVSNYAYLVGGYVLQGAAFALMWFSNDNGCCRRDLMMTAGALAGAGTAVAICSADNGIISFVFWAALVPFFFFASGFRGASARSEAKASALFLAGLSIGFVAVCGLVAIVDPAGQPIAPRVVEEMRRVLPAADFGPQGTAGLLAAMWLAGMGLAALLAGSLGVWLRARFSWPRWRTFAAAFYALLGGAVLLVSFEPLEDFDPLGALPPKTDYVAGIVARFIDGFGPGEPDYFTGSSFWGWFGWLDTPLPLLLRLALQCATGLGLVLLAVCSLRGGYARTNSTLLFGSLLAVALSVAAIAAMYHSIAVSVHGRYLIGVYVFVFVLALEGYRRTVLFLPAPFSSTLTATAALCVGSALVHSVALGTILQRYF